MQIHYFDSIETVIDIKRSQSFRKLSTATALVLKFVKKLKQRTNKISSAETNIEELSVDELQNAERIWLKSAQKVFIADGNIKQLKVSLRLYEDEYSLLRSKTRLCEATDIPLDVKFPVLLPNRHPVTNLIIMNAHNEVMHMAGESTLNRVRQKY